MHKEGAKKERSSIFIFLPVMLLGFYVVYVVMAFAYGAGIDKGLSNAPYKKPHTEEAEVEEVFDYKKLMEPSEELVALGSKVFAANCAACHGEKGLGDGASGKNLATRPRNFHSPANEWKNGQATLTMFHTMETGLGQMPNFPALNPKQKFAVIHYVHHEFVGQANVPPDTADAIASLPAPAAGGAQVKIDAYTEKRVPVKYAIMKMVTEAQKKNHGGTEAN